MKSKILILVGTLVLAQHVLAVQAPQDGAAIRKEVEALIDSPEFQEMFPGVGSSPEDREAFIQQTMESYKVIESMPEDERKKLEQDMMQTFEQQGAQMPETPKPAPAKPQPQEEPKRTQTPEKPAPDVSESRLTGTKEILDDTIDMIEKIIVTFDSLLRVSTDNVREHTWTQKKPELIYALAYLKAIANNDDLTQTLAAHEFTLLHEHIHALDDALRPHVKHIAAPDAAQLRELSDDEAGRAQPLSKKEKKQAKNARNAVIDAIAHSVTDIKFGTKSLLEKYAPKILQQTDKKIAALPGVRQAPLAKSGGGYGSGSGYGSGYNPSSYYPSSYYPSSGSSPQDNYASYPGDSSGRGSTGSYGLPGEDKEKKDKDKTGGLLQEKDKGTKGGVATEKDGKQKTSLKTKQQKRFNEIKDGITKLDDTIGKEFYASKDTAVRITTLNNVAQVSEAAALEDLLEGLRQVNMRLQEVMPYVDQFINAIDGYSSEDQEKVKQPLVDHLKTKKHIENFAQLVGNALQKSGANMNASIKAALTEFAATFNDLRKKLTKVSIDERAKDFTASIDTLATTVSPLTGSTAKAMLANVAQQPPADAQADAAIKLLTQATGLCAQLKEKLDKEMAALKPEEQAKLQQAVRRAMSRKNELKTLADIDTPYGFKEPAENKTQELQNALFQYKKAYNELIAG